MPRIIASSCLAFAVAGCPDVSPPAVTLEIVEQTVRADGTTSYLLRSCITADDPREVEATLDATSGSFLFAPAEAPGSVTFRIDGFSREEDTPPSSCHDEPWTPSRSVQQVRFRLTVDEIVVGETIVTAGRAIPQSLSIRAEPNILPSEGAGRLAVSLDFGVEGGGSVSEGTEVDVVVASEPEGSAAIDDGPIIVGERDSLTVSTAEGTTRLEIEATVRGPEPLVACRVLLVATTTTTVCRLF